MGLSVVKVAAGGLPVTIATNGYGTPCTEATNGYGIAVTQSTTGGGLAVTGFTFGPTIQLSANSVLETAAVNTTVGTLSVSAGTTGSPVFTLVSGGSTFNILGTALRTSVLLDYETTSAYSITVAVSGVSPTVANQTFTILVGDVAEPVILLTGTSIAENSTAGTNIGVLSIANSFTGTPAYTLVDSSSGKVAISGSNLNVLGAIDYETTPTFNITVSVSGIVPAAANKTFTVVVLDVVESASATWNPSDKGSTAVLSNGNLTITTGAGAFAYSSTRATASASTGKYYSEHLIVEDNTYSSFMSIGINDATRPLTDQVGPAGGGYSIGFAGDGNLYDYTAGAAQATLQPWAKGNTVCMAIDLDNRRVWFRVCNGATVGNWNNSGTANPATNTGGATINALMNGVTFYPAITHLLYTATAIVTTANFGATAYAYTKPSGFNNWGGGGAIGATKNIVTDYGAVGDAQWARTTLSIATNVLTSTTAIWSAGDVGKTIVVGFAGSHSAEPGGGSVLISTIITFNSSTSITLANNASWPLSSEPNVIVAWGTNNGKQMPPNGTDATNGPFETFRQAYQGQAVTLTIPAGNYLIASGNFGPLFNGIKNITVNATGATICGGAFQLGSANQSQFYGHSAYTANVSAGATFVTLSTPAYVSRFTVGRYALMTGFGLQYGGFPSNHQRFEYVYITAIDSDTLSPTYGKITFLSPLVNSYSSTWPLFFDETGTTPPPENGQYTSGGPATLYALDARFDHTAVLNNLTIAHHPQMGVSGLDLTLNSCTFESIWGPHVTVCKTVTLNTCLGILCTMEVDKLITAFTMNGCDWGGLSFQSASVTAFVADDTDIRYSITGTPYKCTIRNGSTVGTISGIGILTPSATYGYCNELIVTSSQVKNFGAVTTHESGHVIIGGTSSSVGVNTEFTMSGGVITIPLSYKAYGWIEQWPVTGAKMFFYDVAPGTIGSFSITNVTYDATNVYVTTTASGGWPARSYNPSFGLRLIVHPAPICTFTSVTGCPEVVDLSNAGAAGLPLYSYSKRTYDGSVATMDYWQLYGRVKKIVVTVTQAYTGVFGGAVTLALGINVSNVLIKMSDYTDVTWAPTIDLKKTGTRTFDATANTYPVNWSTTAVAAADSLPNQTTALWAPGNFRPSMTDIHTEAAGVRPIFSIEVITDQG